jgi:outer membrane protein assembly factor BamD (BamD/ComL family)
MQPVSAILILLLLILFSCNESRESDKKTKAGMDQYEWLIDTATILTKEDLLIAASQLRRINEEYKTEKEKNPNERGKFYRILKTKTFLDQKMAIMLETIPGQERDLFLKQFRALMPE